MTSEYQTYHTEYCRPGVWAHPEAAKCGCRGRGWWLAETDAWYPCRFHKGPHPEADETPRPDTGPEPVEALVPDEADDGLPF